MFTTDNGDREDAVNVAIVVTDREGNLQTAVEQAEVAREKDIHFVGVAVGNLVCIMYSFTIPLQVCNCYYYFELTLRYETCRLK